MINTRKEGAVLTKEPLFLSAACYLKKPWTKNVLAQKYT